MIFWSRKKAEDIHEEPALYSAIRHLNDELKIQRCRLKMVRLREYVQLHQYHGVWIIGCDSSTGDIMSPRLAAHLVKCAERRERYRLGDFS